MNRSQLFGAAVAGIMSAAVVTAYSANAVADDAKADAKGHCVGANSCKGKSACNTAGANDCAGKNGCKGKGWMETSKKDCDAMMKKDKNVKFQAMNK
jgi:hypothetical protein